MDKLKRMLSTYMLAQVVLGTLEECPQGFPESTVYVALGSNYDLSVKLIGMLRDQAAINVKGNFITKGDKFDAILAQCNKGINDIKQICNKYGVTL